MLRGMRAVGTIVRQGTNLMGSLKQRFKESGLSSVKGGLTNMRHRQHQNTAEEAEEGNGVGRGEVAYLEVQEYKETRSRQNG